MVLISSKKVQNQIISNLKDPLVQILLKNSHLTKIQVETLLIDVFAEQTYGKKVTLTEKAALRSSLKNISRGSFNRTLQQSRTNMIKSIWTILLLGYLGILETSSLSPYIEASNRLESYMKEYYISLKDIKSGVNDKERSKTIRNLKTSIKNELIETFTNLFGK